MQAGLVICTRPLDQSIALLERALLYVGNDTSLLNIAAACGRPAIGLFAQTLPLIYNPKIKSVAVSQRSGWQARGDQDNCAGSCF
jgi:ADP-heptose:LPS heptosyltransferase